MRVAVPGTAGPMSRGVGGADAESLSAALAWFSRPATAEEPGAGGAARDAEEDEVEAEIIRLLKRAKVRRRRRGALLALGDGRLDGGSEVRCPELDGARAKGGVRVHPGLSDSKAFSQAVSLHPVQVEVAPVVVL